MKLLYFKFIPQSTDFALLFLRLVTGLTLLLNHGLGKVMNFGSMSGKFMNFLGLGSTVSLGLVIFSEFICAALITLGWFTRFAALVVAIGMSVAFYSAHGLKLSQPGSGELAMIYLTIALTLFLAGPGRFSVDGKKGV